MTEVNGSCHCGNVTFSIDCIIEEFTHCDCSLCVKKNAVMLKVHESEFKMKSDWSSVSLYQWNAKIAKHYFCTRCGIYTFHKKRAAPDYYGINVFCLDNFDSSSIPVVAADGATMSLECDNPRSEWLGPTS